jgi:hypothetical protein
MRTKKQIAASRANGRQSHGAVTPEGKARIVNANLWTGLDAEDQVLTWEFQEDFEMLRDEYYTCHPPHSPEARCLVDQLITCEWHLRRFANAELSVWEDLANNNDAADTVAGAARTGDHVFHRIQSRINATRRAFHSALKELERLEARDADVVVVPKNPDGVIVYSNQNDLPVLGSLRQNAGENPAPVPSGLVVGANSAAAPVETPSCPQNQQDDNQEDDTKPGTEGGGLADAGAQSTPADESACAARHSDSCLLTPDSHIPQGYQGRSPWVVSQSELERQDVAGMEALAEFLKELSA